jgi:hypothetical protein
MATPKQDAIAAIDSDYNDITSTDQPFAVQTWIALVLHKPLQ